MADEEMRKFTWRWLAAALLLVISTRVFYTKSDIGWDEGKKEIFAALCEACAGVIFVGGAFSFHRRSVAKSLKDEETRRALVRETRKVERSLALIQTNQSVLTWSKQIEVLEGVSSDLELLEEEMRDNGRRAAADEVKTAILVINGLWREHKHNKNRLGGLQQRFEDDHVGEPTRKAMDRPAFWTTVLDELPELRSAVDPASSLLTPMNQGMQTMRDGAFAFPKRTFQRKLDLAKPSAATPVERTQRNVEQ